MHRITKFDEKSLEHLHTKTLYYFIYTNKDIYRVHTNLFIWNEETNNTKIAFIDIKNENTEYVCSSDLKYGCFEQENFTLIIYFYE